MHVKKIVLFTIIWANVFANNVEFGGSLCYPFAIGNSFIAVNYRGYVSAGLYGAKYVTKQIAVMGEVRYQLLEFTDLGTILNGCVPGIGISYRKEYEHTFYQSSILFGLGVHNFSNPDLDFNETDISFSPNVTFSANFKLGERIGIGPVINYMFTYLIQREEGTSINYNCLIHYSKTLKGHEGLKELRIKLASNIFRLFYFYYRKKVYIITSGYQKKDNKTDQKEIDRALRLMNEYTKGT